AGGSFGAATASVVSVGAANVAVDFVRGKAGAIVNFGFGTTTPFNAGLPPAVEPPPVDPPPVDPPPVDPPPVNPPPVDPPPVPTDPPVPGDLEATPPGATPTADGVPLPVEPDGGIGDAPMPVEPNGGIGGNVAPVFVGSRNLAPAGFRTRLGIKVSNLLAGRTRDADGDRVGMAVVGANGRWQYSIDGGRRWRSLGAASTTKARLLAPTARVRFIADAESRTTGRLSYRLWDQTVGRNGRRVDLGAVGARQSAAFSSAAAMLTSSSTAALRRPVAASSPSEPGVGRQAILTPAAVDALLSCDF
ncbi:MAG: hypothetical protein ACRDD1_03750, partial [Planctomycetia bacterium]